MSGDAIDTAIPLPLGDIAALCALHRVERLDVFGSVLRDDFTPGSDVDFLVTFVDDDRGPWMGRLPALEEDLARLLGRPVDVVDRRGVETSDNWIRRRHILSSARTIYGS